jgi:hypothetical protein
MLNARWYVHYEANTTITDDQAADLADLAVAVHLVDIARDEAMPRRLRLTFPVDAEDHAQAMRKASGLWNRLPVLPIDEPYRVTVEQGDAPRTHGLMSTRAVADLLGVSSPRVRQLSARPGFPRPLAIPFLAGDVYQAEEITEWARTWDREAKGGRPRRPQ